MNPPFCYKFQRCFNVIFFNVETTLKKMTSKIIIILRNIDVITTTLFQRWFNVNNVDVKMTSRKPTENDINIDHFDVNILTSIK